MARLCILSCGDFYPNVVAAVAAEGWKDIDVAAFPPDCAMPPLDWNAVRQRVPADCTQLVIVGNVCMRDLPPAPRGMPPVEMVALSECFDLVAPKDIVRQKIADGAYLMTPSWLKGWENRMRARGFDRAAAAEFFRDFARELVLLDTDSASDGDARLKEMSSAVGLPGTRVVVNLDTVRKRLSSVVENWRARDAVRGEKRLREDADQTALLDLMARLSAAKQESEIVAETCAIFTMLFAPAKLSYFPVEHGQWCIPEDAPSGAADEIARLSGAYAWTESGRGFIVRVNRGEQTLAVLYADELAFPEYKERYLNMALSLACIAALAIEGARTRRILVEAERMASLSVLVAGVAHEVNTPVGVCLAAATTLEGKLRALTEKFSNRTMTHSDLNRYLESASAETKLIVGNLERMGGIIEAFRKVAIERTQPAKKSFVFRGMIEQAIAAAGKGELGDSLAIAITCDPKFVLHSYSSDWTSIVSNLYTNALRHAFRGRASGTIRISARTEVNELIFEFDDDGAGIAPEVLKHIFDPFYTTDMQHGMGLGMHLVYNLVRQCLGGTIVCNSTQGAGTHVRIVVPL